MGPSAILGFSKLYHYTIVARLAHQVFAWYTKGIYQDTIRKLSLQILGR
jgi:hypothetical protein